MTRDDIAAVGEVIARSGMRNQLRAVRVFMEIATLVEADDDDATLEATEALRELAGYILKEGGDAARRDKLKAAAAQEVLPLKKGRATGPIDEGE